MNFRQFIAFVFLILTFNGFAQKDVKLTTTSKQAAGFYKDAEKHLKSSDYPSAEKELKNALKADPRFIEAYIMLGELYSETTGLKAENATLAISNYRRATELAPEFYPSVYFKLAQMEFLTGDYGRAKIHYNRYLKYNGLNPENKTISEKRLKDCNFAIKAVANPVPFKPVNLNDSVNSPADEYISAITADEQTMLLTVRKYQPKNPDKITGEDLCLTENKGSFWTKPKKISLSENSEGEGAACLSPDGQYIYFTSCYNEGGYGSCDIYMANRQGDRWSTPVNLGPNVNSSRWESQPSVSSDGNTLYFASNRAGGFGNSDLWMSQRQSDGSWGKAVNLGNVINTPEDEMSPFIHPDNQTLYFSSRGHTGMGGMDIFVSRKDSLGHWQTPVNLGYPINTAGNEINLIVNAAGNYAYASSDKNGGKGRYDIYRFELYREVRPAMVTYFKGKVFDSKTFHPLQARFELIDLSSGKTIIESFSESETGLFLVCLPAGKNYALNVSKKGYLFYSETFAFLSDASNCQPQVKDIPLQPIALGETVILKNIFFDTDSYLLKPESKIELDKLSKLLTDNKNMKIEIDGHTDNVGSDSYNLQLSQNRAKSVYDYLISSGIPDNRLAFKGFGKTLPIASNDNEQGRSANRRTEFKVIEN